MQNYQMLAVLDGTQAEAGVYNLTQKTFLPLKSANYLLESPQLPRRIYAVRNTGVSFFSLNADGSMALLAEAEGKGTVGCHLAISPDGNFLVTANYGNGVLDFYHIGKNGIPSYSHSFQNAELKNAHFVEFAADGKSLNAVFLGSDRIVCFSFNPADGKVSFLDTLELPAGSGPRHFVYSGANQLLVANELNSTLAVFTAQTLTQTVAGISAAGTTPNYPGAIRLTPVPNTAVMTNRGDNSIAVFSLRNGEWRLIFTFPCQGDWPRDCGFSPDGKLFYVCNERSGNLSLFNFDADSLEFNFTETLPDLPRINNIIFVK